MINKDISNQEERMKDLLYKNTDYRRTSRVIRDLWVLRRDLLKELKEEKHQQNDHQAPKNIQVNKSNPPKSGPPLSGIPQSRTPNPPQSSPPPSGLPQSRTSNPLQSGPPQCGLPQSRVPYTA